jgi:hypothetical protein
MQWTILIAAVAGTALIGSAGCAAEVGDAMGEDPINAGGLAAAEDVAEAESQWTRADCMASYKINVEICNRLPSARERCFAGAYAMLRVCLAGARG